IDDINAQGSVERHGQVALFVEPQARFADDGAHDIRVEGVNQVGKDRAGAKTKREDLIGVGILVLLQAADDGREDGKIDIWRVGADIPIQAAERLKISVFNEHQNKWQVGARIGIDAQL